jgi:hypothetical protein
MELRMRLPALVSAASLVLGGLCLSSCSDAQLYHLTEVPSIPNKVAFTGEACTDNPTERRFPLKVVFAVDASPNNPFTADLQQRLIDLNVQTVNDPVAQADPTVQQLNQQISTLTLRRAEAVRDVVSVLRGADSEFTTVRFGGDSFMLPEGGFTSNTAEVSEAAGALILPVQGNNLGARRTSQALQLAASTISGDLLSSDRGLRARTKYVIVLVQAGPLDDNVLLQQVGGDPGLAVQTLADRIRDLRTEVIESGAADFQFHSVDLAQLSENPQYRADTESLLSELAFAGAGEYLQVCRRDAAGGLVPPGCGAENLSLLGLEIRSARNVLVKKSFVVSNLNARHTNEGAVPDSDADGLTDREEIDLGTDPQKRDTDDDGVGDKVELLLETVGLNPTEPDEPAVCDQIESPTLDTDGDGLTDCEEALLRLDATLFDSDADGTPDLLEFLGGTNFLENDILVDSDFDGENNGLEIRAHTDPRSADALTRAELSYLYREVDLGIRELLFTSQPRQMTGLVIEEVGQSSRIGLGQLIYIVDDPPLLAWQDPSEGTPGEAVEIPEDGVYVLESSCTDQPDRPCEGLDMSITVNVTRALLPPFPVDEPIRVAAAERQCIDFRVRNVTLVQTLAADGKPEGNNDIRIFFGQVPQSSPDNFGIFRVAQFNYRFFEEPEPGFKDPNIADQLVESFRFVLFGD